MDYVCTDSYTCAKYHVDWGCTICTARNTQETKVPENPLLCQGCKSWDDFTHVAFCQEHNYPDLTHSMFENAATTGTGHDDYDKIRTRLEFRPSSHLTSCIVCSCIVKMVNEGNVEPPKYRFAIWRPFPVRITAPWYRYSSSSVKKPDVLDEQCILAIVICEDTENSITNYATMLLEVELHYDTYGQGLRQINRWEREYYCTDSIVDWLASCSSSHSGLCKKPQNGLRRPKAFRLVDVKKCAIVKRKRKVEYAALSYQWSTATTCAKRDLILKTANKAEMKQSQSLRPNAVPEVIEDSMQLCRDLGIRYLWVDRLCIVQDDNISKQAQIDSMDTIYRLAKVTFVACSDRAGAGLPGTSTRPRQTSLQGTEWSLNSQRYAYAIPGDVVEGSQWNTRGWTFQERILSRRLIYFCDNHTFVSCWQALKVPEKRLVNTSKSHQRCEHAGVASILRPHNDDFGASSNLNNYHDLVSKYRTRVLSNWNDILNAFTGLSKIIGSLLESNMLVGLPERYLSQCLLWIYLGSRKDHLLSDPKLPTWSWASWHGDQIYGSCDGDWDGDWDGEWTANGTICGFYGPRHSERFVTLITSYYNDPSELGQTELRPTQEAKIWAGQYETEDEMLANIRKKVITDRERDRVKRDFHRRSPAYRIYYEDEMKFNEEEDFDEEMSLWKGCVHNPWTAHQNRNLDDGTKLMALQHHCLAFNTTMAVLHVQSNTSKSRARAPFFAMDLSTKDGTIVGETAWIHEDWAKHHFDKVAYHVFVIGAGNNEIGPRNRHDRGWGLFVVIAPCEGDIASCEGHPYSRLAIGVVSLTKWSAIKPQWGPVILV